MPIRPTQSAIYDQIASGIRQNLLSLVRAQEQVSTGKRILRPSDDGVGTAISMSLSRQKSAVEAHLTSVNSMQPVLATSTIELEESSQLLSEARALVLQAMNGSQSASDRIAIGEQIDQIADSLFEIANTRFGDRYLFAGTETAEPPFVDGAGGTDAYVRYQGDSGQQRIRIGNGTTINVNLPGNQIFGGDQLSGTQYSGLTGLTQGSDSDSGEGYQSLFLRTDTVSGVGVAGLALGSAGGHTILGDHQLEIDAANRTVQLDNGPLVTIPNPAGDNLVVENEDGAQVVLDLTAWTGAFVSTTLTGEGSISVDDNIYTPLDRTQTNLQIEDPASGNLLHIDATGVQQAGREVVAFKGATNLFDTLRGIADDLRGSTAENTAEIKTRLDLRFDELIQGHERLLTGLGQLGSRSERLNSTEVRLRDLSTQLSGLQSSATDVDMAEAVLELQQAEQTLQLTQATGARLMQQSLLNYLS